MEEPWKTQAEQKQLIEKQRAPHRSKQIVYLFGKETESWNDLICNITKGKKKQNKLKKTEIYKSKSHARLFKDLTTTWKAQAEKRATRERAKSTTSDVDPTVEVVLLNVEEPVPKDG